MKTRRRWLLAPLAMLLFVTGLDVPLTTPRAVAAEGPCTVASGGLIGERWRGLNAGEGPLGCPTGPETDAGEGGRRQVFEKGEVVWSPKQGANMVLSAYLERNEVVVDWSTTLGWNYDFFHVFWSYGGLTRLEWVKTARDRGAFTMPLTRGPGRYEFSVEGCDGVPYGHDPNRPAPTCKEGFTLPVGVTVPDLSAQPSDCVSSPAVHGLIGQRWKEMGGGAGKMGCPTTDEQADPNGRRQFFQHGSMVFSPKQGNNMVVAVYSINFKVFVEWGPTDPFHYEKFLVRWNIDGRHEDDWQVDVKPYKERRREGAFSFDAPNGNVEVIVEGCDGDCKQGWTIPAYTTVRNHGGINLDGISAEKPDDVLRALDQRRAAAARFGACSKPTFGPVHGGEDLATLVASHMEQARREGVEFRCQSQASSVELANRLLRRVWSYKTGSTFDDVPFCASRHGDYDMFLKDLMPTVYRYGHLLYPLTRQHIYESLFTEIGAHEEGDEKIEACNLDVPETENHRLMIETSKYLSNQLLFDVRHHPDFDNGANGMREYLLRHLQQFAKHDFLEYNSRTYSRQASLALMNLYDYARDQEIRTAAQIALDYITAKFGVSSNQLRRSGPFRRQKENEDEEIHGYYEPSSDPMSAFFLLWTGMSKYTYKGIPWHWTGEALAVSVRTYLPPRTAIQQALDKGGEPFQQTFYHGNRPKLTFSPDNPDPGLEIYSSSPSFLLTAGGVWTNSGYGYDVRRGYKTVGSAQSITLMTTKVQGTRFEELIRFRGRSDDRTRHNTCVSGGFACGFGFTMSPVLRTCAQIDGARVVDGNWEILDLTGLGCNKLGVYVAVNTYDTRWDELGVSAVMYVIEASKMDFKRFHEEIRGLNPEVKPYEGGVFRTPDGHTFTYRADAEDKYAQLVTNVDGHEQPHWANTGLAVGPYVNSPGHDGRIELRYPRCGATTVLDYRDPLKPAMSTQWGKCT